MKPRQLRRLLKEPQRRAKRIRGFRRMHAYHRSQIGRGVILLNYGQTRWDPVRGIYVTSYGTTVVEHTPWNSVYRQWLEELDGKRGGG